MRSVRYLPAEPSNGIRASHLLRWITLVLVCLAAAMVRAEAPLFTDVPYVTDPTPEQMLDIYTRADETLPVILFVHGGGWAFGDKAEVGAKPDFFLTNDMAFVSLNYRLRWEYKVIDQLEDIVSAIQWLRTSGADHGLDGNRIVLMGHAAGAHLVSLIATNPNLLRAAGMTLGDINAVVAIDTESYDINEVMQDSNFIVQRQHRLVFGSNEDVWRQYSPIHHIAADKGIPPFAILYAKQATDTDSGQTRRFASALATAGVEVILIPGESSTPASINDAVGQGDDIPSRALLAFLKATL